MDKLLAAKGQVQVSKTQKSAPPSKPSPKAPPAPAKKVEAALAGVKMRSGKAPATKPATAAASASQPSKKAVAQKPKKAPAPRKPSGPGVFTQMIESIRVHIREEIQEIKKELAAQHLFKPFKDGLNSMKKGVSYLKERISEDKSAAGDALKSAYQDVREVGKMEAYDRSDPDGDIASIVDERRKAQTFGTALEKLGSLRQRQTPRRDTASSQDETPSEGASAAMGWPVARAESGEPQSVEAVPRPPGFSSDGSADEDIAPVVEERRQASEMGAALEQLGSMRQRQASSNRPRPQDTPGNAVPPPGEAQPFGAEGEIAPVGDEPRRASSPGVPEASSGRADFSSGASETPTARAEPSSRSEFDLRGDIAPVVDERRQASEMGAALEQLGSMRQRQASSHRPRSQDQPQDTPVNPSGPSGESPVEAQPFSVRPSSGSGAEGDIAPVGDEQRGAVPQASGPSEAPSARAESSQKSAFDLGGDIAPVAQERRQGSEMGAALEQLGSMGQREAASRRPKPQGAQAAEISSAPAEPSPQASGPPAEAQPVMLASEDAPPERAASAAPPQASGGEEIPGSPPEAIPVPMPVQEMRSAPVEGAPTLLQRLTGSQKPGKKSGGIQRKASKTEHQIRAIKALQALFRHPLWRQVVVNSTEKPSQLYIPRKVFEANFAEAEFRNAMKAGSRLAMSFWAEIREFTFDAGFIDEVLAFEFPKVRGQEDPDEKQIAEKCDKETAQRIERFVESGEVKLLLRNSGTRLGTFVPSMEIIARIYLGLKKGSDMNPTARLDIQKDVMFKYQRAKYPEKLARKARNVALRYFFEHLIDYGLDLYKERKVALMEMKMPDETDKETRLESLRDTCGNLTAERASKAVLSAQVIAELREQIRGAINDYEMGIEPGAGASALTSEDENEEEDAEQPTKQPEAQLKEQSEAASRP
ncbi:MAG: hypothetical protein EXS64_17180 [Candidatus Latescibacteria bacterium]|nr:hypothetical protein [Candidatus Latescibacterota bacterium]